MNKRHDSTQDTGANLVEFFRKPTSCKQKQYEAVRAVVVEKQAVKTVAEKFSYTVNTVYSLLRDAKAGKIVFFPLFHKEPQKRKTPQHIQDDIITHRKEGLSSADIHLRLAQLGINVSVRTIERILKDAGFDKLKRRTNKQLGKSDKKSIIPQRSQPLEIAALKPFDLDCPAAGVFFFIPYILESGILNIIQEFKLPQSSDIQATQAALSMLLLKLIGVKRLSHIDTYNQEPGLGVFAGLNVLPKPTYISTYSCRCPANQLMDLQSKLAATLQDRFTNLYGGDFINLDFHSIPHYGDESEMEKVWCGARGKALKGANTVFAQDSRSNALVYTRADILRAEEADEVKKFVVYWKKVRGNVEELLVFDCKFTTYPILDELEEDGVKFITLRKRHKNLVEQTLALPKKVWQRVYLAIPKRKHKAVSVHESQVKLSGCANSFRQIAVKDHGRSKPTFILTNNNALKLKDILEIYARRWRLENKLAELVGFFNLNALSSPIMTRIHFDILWTMVANTLYHRFAQDLRRFEKALSPTIFKKFIDMPGRVVYDGDKFLIKIRKRAHTPILQGVEKLQTPFEVPWLEGKTIQIVWTP